MKNKFKYISWLMLLVLFLVPTSAAYAQGSGNGSGQVLFGTNFVLKSGETFNGDLVLFGGNVTIAEGASLNGNLVVIGGQVESSGKLGGDVVVVGGQVKLEKPALISGDVVTVGGQLQKAEGAKIEGNVVNNVAPDIKIENGKVPSVTPPPAVKVDFNPFWQATGVFYRALIIAALAMLIVAFLKPQMEYVSNAIVRQPVMSGGIGLLAVVGGPVVLLFASLIMIATLILIPVAAVVLTLGSLLLALAWLFGVIALGYEVGERFTGSINQTWAPIFTAGFGTFLVMLIGGALAEIPCVGWVIPALIGFVAVGAVAITRFGTRPVPVSVANVYSPPTDSSAQPPATS